MNALQLDRAPIQRFPCVVPCTEKTNMKEVVTETEKIRRSGTSDQDHGEKDGVVSDGCDEEGRERHSEEKCKKLELFKYSAELHQNNK